MSSFISSQSAVENMGPTALNESRFWPDMVQQKPDGPGFQMSFSPSTTAASKIGGVCLAIKWEHLEVDVN